MKALTNGILGMIALTAAAWSTDASAFQLHARAYVSSNVVEAEVVNHLDRPVVCDVSVAGVRNDGFNVWATSRLYLVPGGNQFAYVYTNYPTYFVNGQAQANCWFY